MKKQFLTAGVCCFLASAFALPPPDGKAVFLSGNSGTMQTFKPEIKGDSIVAGNKRLLIRKGRMILTGSNAEIANFHYLLLIKNSKTEKNHWYVVGGQNNPKLYSFKYEDRKFVYEESITVPNSNYQWKLCTQTVTLLDNGLIEVDFRWNDPPYPELSLHRFGYFINMSYLTAANKRIISDGKTVTIPVAGKNECFINQERNRKNYNISFFPDDPGLHFLLFGDNSGMNGFTAWAYPGQLRFDIKEKREERKVIFRLDLRNGSVPKQSADTRAGIDFRTIENLTMPDHSGKNLLVNPSFEQGINGYFLADPGYKYTKEKWNTEPFRIDDETAFSGHSSFRIHTIYGKGRDYRSLNYAGNVSSPPTVVAPGRYTLSFYAKGDRNGQQSLNVWVPHFSDGPHGRWTAMPGARITVRPGNEWKRYSFSFDVKVSMPLTFSFNATSPDKKGFVWIDAFQLEKGESATPFEAKAAEGRLLTSSADHFISSKAKIKAKMRVYTAPGIKGNAVIRVKNFYDEILFKKEFPFQSGSSGFAEIALPFDQVKFGNGIFMVRADYTLENGKKTYDLHRFTVAEFLENKHPLRHVFSEDYGSMYENHNFPQYLDRFVKVGFGMKSHMYTLRKYVYDKFAEFGIPTVNTVAVASFRTKDKKLHFAACGDVDSRTFITPGTPGLLFRDFYLDADGTITSEYLELVKTQSEKLAKEHPWITNWQFAQEFFFQFPFSWWAKNGKETDAYFNFAKVLKAFADGVRKGNPNVRVSADNPWNMNPGGGIHETDKLLEVCNRVGLKLDRISCHSYRESPESPDLDADTANFLFVLKRREYEGVRVDWPEMMHWGPYTIPAWGTRSASWGGTPVTWYSGALSYDMGWTEKISAAWRVRSWLVALKYSIYTATSSSIMNNFAMDLNLTPFASQMMPNALGHLLGDAKFKKDIRFAAYLRTYIFEDTKKRPVAAVWCHHPAVNGGVLDAPVATADFGGTLESIYDLMYNKRDFTKDKILFAVTPFPLFFRGKPGSLERMVKAFETASIVSGKGFSQLIPGANPKSPDEVEIRMKNLLSNEYHGSIGKYDFTLPSSGTGRVVMPLPEKLEYGRISNERLPVEIRQKNGGKVSYDLSFRAMLAKQVADSVTLDTINWNALKPFAFRSRKDLPALTSGSYRIAWNGKGFFVRADIRDNRFVHTEFPKIGDRWANDCLQIYFDTFADARTREARGYDENDYDYIALPNAAGNALTVYCYRAVDRQLALGAESNRIAKEVQGHFRRTSDGFVCELFFPAWSLRPVCLERGTVFGFGLYAGNADEASAKKNRIVSALTNAAGDQECYNKPHLWPAVLLWK